MPKAIILMYHSVGIPPENARIPNLYVTPRMFRYQMWHLKAAGFKVLSVRDLLAAVESGIMTRNLAAITFDDGFQDFYDNAYPVLSEYGYPSLVYVVTSLVGKGNVWDAEKESVKKPLMDWNTIKEVSRNGVTIGSHTRTHPQLSTLAGSALQDELQGSKEDLEAQLGLPIEHFCYPYGDQTDAVRQEVRNAGYCYAVTTQRGHVVKGVDPLAMRRIPVKLITNPFSFAYKIHTNSEKRKGRQS